MNRSLAIFITFLLFSACAKNSSNDNGSNSSYSTEYTTVDCDEFGQNLKVDENVECGKFAVPESRYDESNTNEVTLAILVLKSASQTPDPDPIVYLHGGPGGLAVAIVDRLAPIFNDARRTRDIILVDQRGSGYSIPFLGCPEILEQKLNRLQIVSDDIHADYPKDTSLSACKERLLKKGYDLASYSTIENTADFDDLRKALKIDKWNLYSVSYGTRVSQSMMHYYPNGIRSVILDSAVPQESSLLDVSDIVSKYKLLVEILDNCAIEVSCNSKYPDIANRFWERISFLEKYVTTMPIDIPELNININPYPFTANNLVQFASGLIDKNEIEELPKKINYFLEYKYSEIKDELIEVMLGTLEEPKISYGAFFSTMCADEYKNPYDENIIDIQDIPEVYKQFWRDTYKSIGIGCEQWPYSKTYGLESVAIVSDIPTLILAGKYDVRTTTNSAQNIGQSLANSTYAEFPKDGHGVLVNPCSQTIRDNFYDNPHIGPDTTCLASIDAQTIFTKPDVNINQPLLVFSNPFDHFNTNQP